MNRLILGFMILSSSLSAFAGGTHCRLGREGSEGEIFMDFNTRSNTATNGSYTVQSTYIYYLKHGEEQKATVQIDDNSKAILFDLKNDGKLLIDFSKEASEYPLNHIGILELNSYNARNYLGKLVKGNKTTWAECGGYDYMPRYFGVYNKPYREDSSRTEARKPEKGVLYLCTPPQGSFDIKVKFYGQLQNGIPVINKVDYAFGDHKGILNVKSSIVKRNDGGWIMMKYNNNQLLIGLPYPEKSVHPILFEGSVAEFPNVGQDAHVGGNGFGDIRVGDGFLTGLNCRAQY